MTAVIAGTEERETGIDSEMAEARRRREPSGTELIVRPFQMRDGGAWQDYVDHHADGTLFHGLAWKQAVERSFGHRYRSLIALRRDKVVGVFPLCEVRSVLAGRLLVSVPYATYGGILADEPLVAEALFDAARRLCLRIRARSIEMRSIQAARRELEIRATHATFRKALPGTVDGVMPGLPRKARAAARRAAEKHALTVEFGDENLEILWRLYARSMRRLASVNYPLRFFRELVAATPGQHVVELIRCAARPVAGLLSFLYRDRVMPYFVGLDERAEIYGLSHYVYAESMRWGVAHGYREYDFGRTRLANTGPFNFKRFCGFEPSMLEYQTFVVPGRAEADLSPASPRWAAARRWWKSLPLTITRPLGGWLSRSIPG